MTALVERKVHGITLRAREHFTPKVKVGAHTAPQKDEVVRAARHVIELHRKVLIALKDR